MVFVRSAPEGRIVFTIGQAAYARFPQTGIRAAIGSARGHD
jgi:hypothetical protein